MNFTTVDVVYLTLAFITPGLIITYIRSQFITGRIPKPSEQTFTYLALSGINYGLFSWLIYLVLYDDWFRRHAWASSLAWLFLLFLAPLIIGFVSAISVERELFRKFCKILHLVPVNAFPTSWDRKFCYQRKPCYLIVTMKDSSLVAGYYGGDSFASSEPAERDIFIEQIYDVQEDGAWQEGKPGHGILILHSEIRYVEFFPGESSHDREKTASLATHSSVDEEILRPGFPSQGQLPADQERSETEPA